MTNASERVLAWNAPTACCESCDLCEHQDVVLLVRRAPEPRPVRQEAFQRDTAERVFGHELDCY